MTDHYFSPFFFFYHPSGIQVHIFKSSNNWNNLILAISSYGVTSPIIHDGVSIIVVIVHKVTIQPQQQMGVGVRLSRSQYKTCRLGIHWLWWMWIINGHEAAQLVSGSPTTARAHWWQKKNAYSASRRKWCPVRKNVQSRTSEVHIKKPVSHCNEKGTRIFYVTFR